MNNEELLDFVTALIFKNVTGSRSCLILLPPVVDGDLGLVYGAAFMQEGYDMSQQLWTNN